MGYDLDNILTITMPSFGTSKLTRNNALECARLLGTELREISIEDAVLQHFKDISYDETMRDVVYENAQARERTQILMDLANKEGALLVGTGDLSESALGFSTYNADHMSMYNVNCDVPKTVIPLILRSFVKEMENAGKDSMDKEKVKALKKIVEEIIQVPVSPELLPYMISSSICIYDTAFRQRNSFSLPAMLFRMKICSIIRERRRKPFLRRKFFSA